MKKAAQIIISVLLTAVIVPVSLPFTTRTALAADTLTYIALGDSVPEGIGLNNPEGEGYVGLLTQHLEASGHTVNAYNWSVSGFTTSDLLNVLNNITDPEQTVLAEADIITLNIGGNNFYSPVYAAIYQAAAELDIKNIAGATPEQMERLIHVMRSYRPSLILIRSLQDNLNKFYIEFPNIISLLNTLAPRALIVVSTIYNPVPPGLSVSGIADSLITGMNKSILEGQQAGGYFVADTYTSFVMSLSDIPLINFNIEPANGPVTIDVHPTAAGHRIYAQKHIEAISQTSILKDDKINVYNALNKFGLHWLTKAYFQKTLQILAQRI